MVEEKTARRSTNRGRLQTMWRSTFSLITLYSSGAGTACSRDACNLRRIWQSALSPLLSGNFTWKIRSSTAAWATNTNSISTEGKDHSLISLWNLRGW
jgi:hypothetical protein